MGRLDAAQSRRRLTPWCVADGPRGSIGMRMKITDEITEKSRPINDKSRRHFLVVDAPAPLESMDVTAVFFDSQTPNRY